MIVHVLMLLDCDEQASGRERCRVDEHCRDGE
jgi:hypothetical protein